MTRPRRTGEVTTMASPPTGSTLSQRLTEALAAAEEGLPAPLAGIVDDAPIDRHDRFSTLLTIYDLRLGSMSPRSAYAEHPSIAALKWRLEADWKAELDSLDGPAPTDPD